MRKSRQKLHGVCTTIGNAWGNASDLHGSNTLRIPYYPSTQGVLFLSILAVIMTVPHPITPWRRTRVCGERSERKTSIPFQYCRASKSNSKNSRSIPRKHQQIPRLITNTSSFMGARHMLLSLTPWQIDLVGRRHANNIYRWKISTTLRIQYWDHTNTHEASVKRSKIKMNWKIIPSTVSKFRPWMLNNTVSKILCYSRDSKWPGNS